MRRIFVSVVSAVVAQGVVDLETQLTSREVECGAPHVTEEHLHRDLQLNISSDAYTGRES